MAKYALSTGELVYFTYLGGSENDTAVDIAVDPDGMVYLTGSTTSSNFTTQNPFQPTFGGGVRGGVDAFVMKLDTNAGASGLVYSSYLGGGTPHGNGIDEGSSIVLDSTGNAWVSGYTGSDDFPTTADAFQRTSGSSGGGDAFLTKVSPTGQLLYSTYFGGNLGDFGAVHLDVSGNVYLVGYTTSNSGLPTTRGAVQPMSGGGMDGFVAKFDASGRQLLYSTYLGGSGDDFLYDLAVDAAGNVYVGGDTSSPDFRTTLNAFQPTYHGDPSGHGEGIMVKLSPTLSAIEYSTFFGGSGAFDSVYDIELDPQGFAYLAGPTNSPDFPITNPLRGNGNLKGEEDGFVAKLDLRDSIPRESQLVYSTFLGGSVGDQIRSLFRDADGKIYVTGHTASDDFPVTSDAAQRSRGESLDAFLTILSENENDNWPPNAHDDSAVTDEDTPVTIAVLNNDSDPDGGALTAILVSGPVHGFLTLNANGSFTYTPNANYNGSDSFTYLANDGLVNSNVATVSLTITPINDDPVAVDDSATTTQNTPVTTVNVLANDSDVDGDSLTISSFTQPLHGHVISQGKGTFTYSPNTSFVGTDSFTYIVSDGHGGSSSATVRITVTETENHAPVAVNDSATTSEDTPVTTGSVLANDSDADGDPLTISSFTQPAHGAVALAGNGGFLYTPAGNFVGTDGFTYTISDGRGGTSTATVRLTITPVNDAPVAVNDTATTAEDTPVTTTNVLANDSDVDGDPLTISSFTQPAHGSVASAATGKFTYSPTANFNGADSFTYTISDGHGGTTAATVTLTVSSVNDAPSFAKGADQTTLEDSGTQSVASWATSISTGPADETGQAVNFLVMTNNDALFSTLPTISATGTLAYTPAANANGTATVTVRIHDNGGTANGGVDTSAAQLFSITVTTVNDLPEAADDTAETEQDIPVDIPVLANDSDPDTGDRFRIRDVSDPGVTIQDNGTADDFGDDFLRYTPAAGFHGTATFTYTIEDSAGATDSAAVSVIVNPGYQGVQFHVNYLDEFGEGFRDIVWGDNRRDAFERGLAVWTNHLPASYAGETITIDARMDPFGGNTLAATSTPFVLISALSSNTRYAASLANHLLQSDSYALAEYSITFDSEQNWNYDDTPIPANAYDFATVTLHEVGHGLGFAGLVRQNGTYGVNNTFPSNFDRFLETGVGTDLAAMTNSGRAAAIVSNSLFWNGDGGIAGQNGQRPQMYAPSPYVSGSSVSHLDETVHSHEVMSPQLAAAEVHQTLSPMELGMFADLGWDIRGLSQTALLTQLVVDPASLFEAAPTLLLHTVDYASAVSTSFDAATGALDIVMHEGANISVSAHGADVVIFVNSIADDRFQPLLGSTVRSLTVQGSEGTDRIDLSRVTMSNFPLLASVRVNAGNGDDTLLGSERSGQLFGEDGNDSIQGGAAQDVLDGGAGNDSLTGGGGNDSLDGGAGTDQLLESADVSFSLTATKLSGLGRDQLKSFEQAVLTGGNGNNRLDASAFKGNVTLIGGDGNDSLIGGAAKDQLDGGNGNDKLEGRSGDDLLLGGADNDSMLGGLGNDTLGGGTGNDTLDGGDGNDALAGQDGHDSLTGGKGSDTLLGQAGDDQLLGGLGRDLLQGGIGNDRLNGEKDIDTVMGGSGRGADAGDLFSDPRTELNEALAIPVLDWLNQV